MEQRLTYECLKENEEVFLELLTRYVLGFLAQKNAFENTEDEEEFLLAVMGFKEASDVLWQFKASVFGEEEAELPDPEQFYQNGAFNGHLFGMYAAAYTKSYLPYGEVVGLFEMYHVGRLLKEMEEL